MLRRYVLTARTASAVPSFSMCFSSTLQLDRKYLIRNYNPDGIRSLEGVEFERGSGCRLFDTRGREYVDWAAGIAVNGK